MRVLLYAEDSAELTYLPCFIDENKFVGYYLTFENYEDDSVNIIIGGEIFTFKQSDVLMDYLHSRFGKDEFILK